VRRMITRWAMGDLGPVAFQADDQQPFLGYELAQGRDYSESTAARIDQEVQRVLAEQYEAARKLLLGSRAKLDSLVEQLLEEETVLEDQLTNILGPRPTSRVASASLP
jgi:cell division protease FtsH